jgi:hypothetical protein
MTKIEWIEKTTELCSYCGKSAIGGLHSDHVHPRSLGGSDEDGNRVPACAQCNVSKGNKPLPLWLATRPERPVSILDRRLGRRHLAVLNALWMARDTNGVSAPTRAILAMSTGYTLDSIAKTIWELRSSGYVRFKGRKKTSTSTKAIAHYLVIGNPLGRNDDEFIGGGGA